MQDTTFRNAILNLRDVQKDQLFTQLHGIFIAINQMSLDEAISAYQTLRLMKKMMDDHDAKAFAEHFIDALDARMHHLAYSGKTLTQQVNMQSRVSRVTSSFF